MSTFAECAPGAAFDWHVHNGSVFFLVLQGKVELQYEDGAERYQAGDVYSEPIGCVHRAVNPHRTSPAVFIGFVATPADRGHIIPVGPPAWYPGEDYLDPTPDTRADLGHQPRHT